MEGKYQIVMEFDFSKLIHFIFKSEEYSIKFFLFCSSHNKYLLENQGRNKRMHLLHQGLILIIYVDALIKQSHHLVSIIDPTEIPHLYSYLDDDFYDDINLV